MALVDMKEDRDEGLVKPAYAQDAGPCYPCGLQISLCDQDLTKLGITDLPEIGEIMILDAKVKVTRIQDEQGFYGRNRNLGLQITEMELKESGKESDEAY